MARNKKKTAARAALAVSAAVLPAAAAQAATITVNTLADAVVPVDDGQCSLREAIANANANALPFDDCVAGTGLDTIQFSVGSMINLAGASLTITDPLIIDGPGPALLTIDAGDASRIFTIEDADSSTSMDVEINDLTLANGNASSESIDGGGAIFNVENLRLSNVTLSSNSATAGGAVVQQSSLAGSTLTITGSTLIANVAPYGGAILSDASAVIIEDSTITANDAALFGGALAISEGTFSLTDSTVSQNVAGLNSGGIALYYVSNINILRSTITLNQASNDVGGLYIYAPLASVTIADSFITDNTADNAVGGLHISFAAETEVIVRDTEISGNQATAVTGGLYLYDSFPVTLERVRIVGNSAGDYQGGGALWSSTVAIIESEISGNESAHAGGLYAGYGTYLYLINTTIANNTALTGSVGGLGVNNSLAAIDVSTISGNSAPGGAAGNVFAYASNLYLSNSIIADGTATAGPDLVTSDSTTVMNFSLLENTSGASFTGSDNILGVDPQLGPLQNNGGPTQTMKPALTSPVVDAGSPEYTTPPNDQRGFPRPIGVVDMGAVELSAGTLDLSAPASVVENAGFVTVTVTRTGGSDGAASVDYATSSGTALAGADFTTTTGTLNWADGDSAPKSFNVPINNDVIFEGPEQFTVTLTNAVGATLGASSAPITITDDDSAPTITINDPSGNEGGVVTFTVSLSNPTTQTVTVDYATAGVSAISGTDFTAAGNTLTFDPLVTSLLVNVGTIQDAIDEPNETFTLNLTNATNASILDASGTGTINDEDPTPTISIGDSGALEGANVVFDVTLSGPSSQTVTVNFGTTGGTATSGDDFTANSGTVTFTPGDTTEQVSVATTADTTDEATETFTVTLSSPNANATIGDGTATGTITDDDGASALSISDVLLAEGTGGPTSFVFNVSLLPASGQTVTVDFTTQDGTATSASGDYTPNAGTLTFLPGDTSETITVLVNGDAIVEPDENFTVVLSNAPLATSDDSAGLGTIINDDVPSLIVSDVALAEGDAGTTNFVFNVTLSAAHTQTVTVNYTTSDGTAAAGSDYTTTAGTLTFNPGDTSESIIVPVAGDTAIEGDETFNVVLSVPSQATISDGSGLGTITNDDAAPVADLSVTKAVAGVGPFVVGQNATFTITVSNAGPDAATNATVTDILPAGTTYVSATPSSGSCLGTATVVCNVGTLSSGGNATITLTVQLNAPGTITNTATAASDAGDVTPAAGSAGITVSAAAAGAAIPTLSQWMLIALATALAAAAAARMKP